MVGTAPRLEYITWKDVLKGKRRKKSRIRTETLVQFYYSTKPYDTNCLIYSEDRFSNLVSNSLEPLNLIVFLLR